MTIEVQADVVGEDSILPDLGQLSDSQKGLLVAVPVLGGALLQRHLGTHPYGRTETWGCGYTGPTARMQYTFGQ